MNAMQHTLPQDARPGQAGLCFAFLTLLLP